MYPAAILGFSFLWYDAFEITSDFSARPYRYWNAIKVEPNQGTGEIQWYDTSMDLTYMHMGSPHGSPMGLPQIPDQLFLMPQRDKTGKWTSARLEGKEAYGCPEGKQLILQAELRVGNASSDRQGGIWPAFWALGESRNRGVEWPLCGEWDIMETSDGHDWSLASAHWGAVNANGQTEKYSLPGPDYSSHKNNYKHTDFHTWSIKVDRRDSDWKKQTLQWSMDGNLYYEVKGSDVNNFDQWKVVAHQKYYPVFNVAVGSNFPEHGTASDKTATGIDAGMVVNYVAFYVSD
ncbi:endo-1,3(4)-beta-glucanase [Rhypophila decipiens]|uniref:Endo-1,3(4)-beta-glucanase n=1 Tax=Rhypophila decipiens TaxID=261697 RepID=A0AAN7B2H0_9PEZI|nr:endo-1,3(4)-beta-glucanase [Rhypophila decipiens]